MRVAMLTALILLAACSSGTEASGGGASRSYPVSGFSKIAATGPDNVDVRVGSGFSVRAEGDPTALDRIVIVQNGDTLEIKRKSGFSWGGGKGATIYITMPRIVATELTGSGDVAIDHVEGEGFSAHATGSGNLSIASLTVRSVDIDLVGSGGVTVAGAAASGKLSAAGSGDIDAAKLTLKQAEVTTTGSGDIRATVAGPARIDATGSGGVTLTGGATCTTTRTGSGDVSCR